MDDNETPILPLADSPAVADVEWQLKSALAGGQVQLTVPQNPGYVRNETSPLLTVYGLTLFFATAIKYTLTIDHCDVNGALIENLVDIDFTRDQGNDQDSADHVESVSIWSRPKLRVYRAPMLAATLFSLVPAWAGDHEPPDPQANAPKTPAAQPAAKAATATPSVLPPELQWLESVSKATDGAKSVQKQTQSIAIDHGSTSLIDESSGTDLVSTALSLTPVSSGTAGGGATGTSGTQGSGTVTASLYSVYALASKQDPLKPSVYNSHAGMRKFFFTLGREQQNSSSSSSSSSTNSSGGSSPSANALPKATTTSGTAATPAAQPGTVYGVQWLIVNNRDASGIIKHPQSFAKLTGIAQMEAGIIAKYTKLLSDALCNHQACTFTDANAVVQAVAKLTKDQKAALDKVVDEYSTESKKADVANSLTAAVQELEQRSQFSLNFQTTQRTAGLPDDYRAELVFDRGFEGGWLFTLNGSYDYSNSAMIGADLRTERGALQISRNLINSGTHLEIAAESQSERRRRTSGYGLALSRSITTGGARLDRHHSDFIRLWQ